MPFYGKIGEHYICSVQCGAGRDAYLRIKFGSNQENKIKMTALDPITNGLSQDVEPEKIMNSVLDILPQINEKFKSNYSIEELQYIPNYSAHYDLYAKVIYEAIKHHNNNGKFKVITSHT